jgi:hypothetical protein
MKKKLIIIVALLACLVAAVGAFELYETYLNQPMAISTSTVFPLPNYNFSIMFAQNGFCAKAYFDNYSYSSWEFRDLYFGSQPFQSTYPTSGQLTVSGMNCNITITDYDQTGEKPRNGSFNYTVSGSGSQTLSFGGTIQDIKVSIDGKPMAQNNGWTLERNGNLLAVNKAESTVNIQYTILIPVPA